MRTRKQHRSAGFTLIELLLVMVILVVLAAIVVPRFTGRSEQARVAATKTDIAQMSTAIDAFEVDNGRYPSTEEGLGALISPPTDLPNWHGPYIKGQVKPDQWGHPYVYRFPGAHDARMYDLFSTGPDGREGNDDIGNQ